MGGWVEQDMAQKSDILYGWPLRLTYAKIDQTASMSFQLSSRHIERYHFFFVHCQICDLFKVNLHVHFFTNKCRRGVCFNMKFWFLIWSDFTCSVMFSKFWFDNVNPVKYWNFVALLVVDKTLHRSAKLF